MTDEKYVWHFENSDYAQLLIDEAYRLAGLHPVTKARIHSPTPFREHSRAPGPRGGVDCVGTDELLYIAGKLFNPEEFLFPRSDADYQSSAGYRKVLHFLRGRHPDPQSRRLSDIFAEIDLPEEKANIDPNIFMVGDLLVCRRGGVGGSMFHLPVSLGGAAIAECHRPAGVSISTIHDTTFSDHLEALFRAKAKS